MIFWHHWGKIQRHWLQNPSLPLFSGQSQFSRRVSVKNQAPSLSCMEYCQYQLIHKTHVRQSHTKSNSLKPLIASHVRLSKISASRAVICYRPALEFIFICQNANVNVQKEPLSLGAKEADPLVFFLFCPTSLLFSFLLGGELF